MNRFSHYSGMRASTNAESRSADLFGHTNPTKTLSKLDSARLKLSKFKLKYGKQEREKEMDSPLSSSDLSSADLSSERSSPGIIKTPLNIPELVSNQPPENLEIENNPNVNFRNSGDQSSGKDSSKSVSEIDQVVSYENEQPLLMQGQRKIDLEFSLIDEQRNEDSQSDSTISEISQNVHSISSLQPGDAIEGAMKDNISSGDRSVKNRNDSISMNGWPGVLTMTLRQQGESEVISIASSVSSELQSKHTVADVKDTQSSVSSSIAVSKKERSPGMVSKDFKSNTKSMVASEERKNTEIQATRPSINLSPEKSPVLSNPTIIPPKKEPNQRNAKVQTDIKRSRTVQVNLSSTESDYERRICPVLRATSLPPGLRRKDSFDILGMEDAMEILLKSQLHLTLGLLRRQQDVYLRSCSAAARLEKGYHHHTLSDTRRFIRQERRLRRSGELEKGTVLLRKQ